MKNLLLFLLSFCVVAAATLLWGISSVQANPNPIGCDDGMGGLTDCYFWYILDDTVETEVNKSGRASADITCTGITFGSNQTVTPPSMHIDIIRFYGTGSAWYQSRKTEWLPYAEGQAIIEWITSRNPEAHTDPRTIWPSQLDAFANSECVDEPPGIDCGDLQGQQFNTVLPGKYPTGPFCSQNCELLVMDGEITVYSVTTNSTLSTLQYSGQDGASGCTEISPDPAQDCNDAEQTCTDACAGIEMDFTCDVNTGLYACNCRYPDPIVTNNNGESYPDQDKDGLGSGEAGETDNDGDGQSNGNDPDVDGDGESNGQDKNTDGDFYDNRGNDTRDSTYTWNINHNGIGADPDVDGDGTDNGSDPDIDGDDQGNGSDPDMDGDGVGNGPDLDANGDGILDGSQDDPDGDGIVGADDSDPDGSDLSDADTNGDGVVDENDEPYSEWPSDGEVGGTIDGVSDNSYNSELDPLPDETDWDETMQPFIDDHPFKSAFDNSELSLVNQNPCLTFPNPYTGGTEQFCFDEYDTQFRAMGLVLLGLAGFICFQIIKG